MGVTVWSCVLCCFVLCLLSLYVDLSSTCASLSFIIINLSHICLGCAKNKFTNFFRSIVVFSNQLLLLDLLFLSSENCINNLVTRVNTLQEVMRPHHPENITFLLSHPLGVNVHMENPKRCQCIQV